MIARIAIAVGALVLTGCASHPSHSARASKYLAIAAPANRQLDESFDALQDRDDDLQASAALLKQIAATERHFNAELRALNLGATASALIKVNEARANLTADATTATSVDSLHRYEVELDAVNVPVEDEVRALRKELGLPPPDTD